MHERVMRENYAKAYKLVVILAVVLAADGGVAVSQRRQRGNEQVPVDDSGLGGQSSGGGRVPYRARRAPAEEGGGVTMGFLTPFHGFSMALADSVPGVSGGRWRLFWGSMTASSTPSTTCSFTIPAMFWLERCWARPSDWRCTASGCGIKIPWNNVLKTIRTNVIRYPKSQGRPAKGRP